MWPETVPCSVADPTEIPEACHPYYVRNAAGRWVLDDLLGHIKSVQTPPVLVPVYQIRQYSHRRAAFLRRDLLPPAELAHLPHYPDTRDAYERRPDADNLRAELLYDVPGRMHPELRKLWGE